MEGFDITGGFKFSIGRPGLLRAADAALRRPGTVVPTSAGLRPTRMAKKFNLPYFAKATKGCFFKFHAYGQKARSAGGDRSESLLVCRYRQAKGSGRREFYYRCLRA